MAAHEQLREPECGPVIYLDGFEDGILRHRNGDGFTYVRTNGEQVIAEMDLRRIASLVIPPAWEEVWISCHPNTHIQAVGRDARGRRQYRYHSQWARMRQETKFGRMLEFGGQLPRIRRRVKFDLDLPGLTRAKVLACVIRILDDTGARVGTWQYSIENETFGIASILDEHVTFEGEKILFRYRSKGGKFQEFVYSDKVLARIIRRCQDLPGQRLFEYVQPDGKVQPISSDDVNAYLREVTGKAFTSKDFRTWKGSVLALSILSDMGQPTSRTRANKNIVQAVKEVAEALGNRPATARKYYIHPAILDAYTQDRLDPDPVPSPDHVPVELSPMEHQLLALLRREAKAVKPCEPARVLTSG